MKGGPIHVAKANLKFSHGKNIAENTIINPGTFYLDTEKNELWYDDPAIAAESGQHIRLFDSHFNEIFSRLDDIQYQQIGINTFNFASRPSIMTSNNLVERGNVVRGDLRLNWATSKPPIYLKVHKSSPTIIKPENPEDNEFAENTGVSSGTITIANVDGIASNQTFWLEVGDNRTIDPKYTDLKNVTKSTSITFCYPVFYGSIVKGEENNLTSESLRALENKVLKTDKKGNYKINSGTVADNKITVIAFPDVDGFKNPSFTLGGFSSKYPTKEIEYVSDTENPYRVKYIVYYGTNIGLGEDTIVVS